MAKYGDKEMNLGGNLPAGLDNGLLTVHDVMCKTPAEEHVIVGVVDAGSTKHTTDTGEIAPTVRVKQAEVVTGDDARVVRDILNAIRAGRTGELAYGNGSADDPGDDGQDAVDDDDS